jgi:hypothetical protein
MIVVPHRGHRASMVLENLMRMEHKTLQDHELMPVDSVIALLLAHP